MELKEQIAEEIVAYAVGECAVSRYADRILTLAYAPEALKALFAERPELFAFARSTAFEECAGIAEAYRANALEKLDRAATADGATIYDVQQAAAAVIAAAIREKAKS